LAASQVQDKRIELLEQGPEISADQFLLDFVLSLAFGPIATRLVGAITKRLFTRMLRSRTLGTLLISRSRKLTVADFTKIETVEIAVTFLTQTTTGQESIPFLVEIGWSPVWFMQP